MSQRERRIFVSGCCTLDFPVLNLEVSKLVPPSRVKHVDCRSLTKLPISRLDLAPMTQESPEKGSSPSIFVARYMPTGRQIERAALDAWRMGVRVSSMGL